MVLEAVFTFVVTGLLLGLAAGVSPGPLLTVVIQETLRHGLGAGLRVALAPLITDAPVIVASFLVARAARDIDPFAGTIALLGALYLGWLGIESWRVTAPEAQAGPAVPRSLRRGITVNLLNPNLYLHWFIVGGPLLSEAHAATPWAAAAFLAMFYITIVASKSAIAALVASTRRSVQGRGYVWINRLLGVALLVFALGFLFEGATRLGLA